MFALPDIIVVVLIVLITIVLWICISHLICDEKDEYRTFEGGTEYSAPIRSHVKLQRVEQPKPTKIGQHVHFADHTDFTPNLTPRQIFLLGSFGGTYWRPIHSAVTHKDYKDQHLEFAKYKTIDLSRVDSSRVNIAGGAHREVTWWEDIPDELLTRPDCDKSKNRYGVSSGASLKYWETHNWMHPQDPYGWVQWYCRFYAGRRTQDDARQISRWKSFAGPKGRFRLRLVHLCKRAKAQYDDETISPVIRQGLQHWAYVLTEQDMHDVKS